MVKLCSSGLVLVVAAWVVCFASTVAKGDADIVSYVSTPACATAVGGCDFLGAIWNSTITNTSILLVETADPITLKLTDSTVSVSQLIFGHDGASVNVILSNSNLNVLAGALVDLAWFGESTLSVTQASTVICSGFQGTNLTLDNSYISAQIFQFNTLVATNGATFVSGSGGGGNSAVFDHSNLNGASIDITYALFNNSVVSLRALNVEFEAQVYSTSFQISQMLNFPANSALMEMHDCASNISQLMLSQGTKFSYYVTDSSNQLAIGMATYYGSINGTELNLGDNVVAAIGFGNIRNLTVGSNVALTLGSLGDMLQINTIYQYANSLTTINVVGEVHLYNATALASVIVASQGQFNAYYVQLTSGSSVVGSGALVIFGVFDCPTVQIDTVTFDYFQLVYPSPIVVNVDDFKPTSVSFTYAATVQLKGAVTILGTNTTGGIEFFSRQSANTMLAIEGSYTQIGGLLNITFPTNANATKYLQVSGAVVIQNATIMFNLWNVDDAKGKKVPLGIVSTSDNMNANHTVVTSIDDFGVIGKYAYTLTTSKGELFCELPEDQGGFRGFLEKYKLYLIIAGSVVGAIILVLVVVLTRKLRHKRHYEQIRA